MVKSQSSNYRGRFAPSPTGPLHAGSLVAALASWLDAKAQRGKWLVRIEDIDPPRCAVGADGWILKQLADCGLHPDSPPVWQSQRSPLYVTALEQLKKTGACYPCSCTRKQITDRLNAQGVPPSRHHIAVYPGTCRPKSPLAVHPASVTPPLAERERPVAWRFQTQQHAHFDWQDRRLGSQQQRVATEVGDFVLKRADGLWAYQLAVVVDDAEQGITDVVRGEDLADNTARQIALQQALGLPTPRYLHLPLVRDAGGEKLSKQHGAMAVQTDTPAQALDALQSAAARLGLSRAVGRGDSTSLAEALHGWCQEWQEKWQTLMEGPD